MKKKIFSIALLVSVLAIAVMGATTAYFTDTKSAVNTFTAGNVAIKLTEKNSSGTVVEIDSNTGSLDYGSLYPGRVIVKEPTITLADNSENAYVAARVIVSNGTAELETLLTGLESSFLSGGLLEEGATVEFSYTDDGDLVYYVKVNTAQAKTTELMIYESVNIPSPWNNSEIAKCGDLTITIEAYAVQAVGFSDANTALTTAFDAFDGVFGS